MRAIFVRLHDAEYGKPKRLEASDSSGNVLTRPRNEDLHVFKDMNAAAIEFCRTIYKDSPWIKKLHFAESEWGRVYVIHSDRAELTVPLENPDEQKN